MEESALLQAFPYFSRARRLLGKTMLRLLAILAFMMCPALAVAAAMAEEPLPLPAPEIESEVPKESNETEGFTLGHLEMLAHSHPAIGEAAGKVRAARGQAIQAGLYPNPIFGYMGTEIGNEGSGGQQGGFLEQEYVTAHKLDYAQQAACWEVRRREQELARVQLAVMTEVRVRYYETIIAQRAIKVVSDLKSNAEDGLKLTEDRKAAQEVSEVDVLQSRFEAEGARLCATQTETELLGARRRLEAALGGVALAEVPITDGEAEEQTPLTWEQAWLKLQSTSPQLAAAQLDIERARWELRRQIAQRIPNITFQGAVQDDHATGDTVVGAMIAMPLPIYNCNEGNIEAARGELAAAQRAVGRLEAELQSKMAVVFREYQTALQQSERYRERMLPDADRALQLVRMAYGSGEVDYLRLLSAQQNYGRAHLQYLKTLEIVWTRRAQIEGLLTTVD
jgi:cobalt-zinc-cadmium efflux system outer membrane protein